MKKILGKTWVGWSNILFLQWFFVRLTRIHDSKTMELVGMTLMTGVIPLTGWRTNYIKLWDRGAIPLWKHKAE